MVGAATWFAGCPEPVRAADALHSVGGRVGRLTGRKLASSSYATPTSAVRTLSRVVSGQAARLAEVAALGVEVEVVPGDGNACVMFILYPLQCLTVKP